MDRGLAKLADRLELFFLGALLVFSPLARGGAPRWAFCVSAVLALCAFFFLVLKRYAQDRTLLPRTGLELPVLIMLVLITVSYLISIYPAATLWAMARFILYLVVFYLAYDLTYIRRRVRWLALFLACLAVFEIMVGIVKYNEGNLPMLWSYTEPRQAEFLTGTYLNHNHFAGYLEMVMGLVLGFLAWRQRNERLLAGTVLPFIVVGLILSLSRGAWMGSFVAVLLLFLAILEMKPEVPSGRKWLAAGVVALSIGLFIMGANPAVERLKTVEDESAAVAAPSRVTVWDATLDLIAQRPILGSGLGTFPWSFTRVRPAGLGLRWYEAHNDYLQIVSEMGLLVVIPLGWGLFLIVRRGMLNMADSSSSMVKAATTGALFGIVAILVHSITDFNLQITANGIIFSLLVGLVMGGLNLEGWYEDRQSNA